MAIVVARVAVKIGFRLWRRSRDRAQRAQRVSRIMGGALRLFSRDMGGVAKDLRRSPAVKAGYRVHGLRELQRDLGGASSDFGKDLRAEILDVAGIVTDEAKQRAARYGPGVASSIRPSVRGTSAFVQSRARSKGIRPQFGSLLMRDVYLPALAAKEDEVVRAMEAALDRTLRKHNLL